MKNAFLQSHIIALQHIKNSAWAIEKLYSKTCVRKGFLRVVYTTIAEIPLIGRSVSAPPLTSSLGPSISLDGHFVSFHLRTLAFTAFSNLNVTWLLVHHYIT